MEQSCQTLVDYQRRPDDQGGACSEKAVLQDVVQSHSTRAALILASLLSPCWCGRLVSLLLVVATTGCGSFVAHRMAQAPNSYPQWFGGLARVELVFQPDFLTNFPGRRIEVGPPAATLHYRVVEPGDYCLAVSSSSQFKHGRRHITFRFDSRAPGITNAWTTSPRGTVVLLHGYGLAQFAMAPWALRLAADGWRCLLVDLRGHGKSTGRQVYFGVQEARDLSQLLDAVTGKSELAEPVAVFGESYGAALALRWKGLDPRVRCVVAMAPYPVLSNAVLNICHDYTPWLPSGLVRAGLSKLPSVLPVTADELDPVTALARKPVRALFVAGEDDKIAPPKDVQCLYEQAEPGSEFFLVPDATHEAMPYFLDELAAPVLAWLNGYEKDLKSGVQSPQPSR